MKLVKSIARGKKKYRPSKVGGKISLTDFEVLRLKEETVGSGRRGENSILGAP